jgi:hypothetical protein
VPSAIKYKTLDPNSSSSPNLITYEFPDLAYTASPQFTAVANKSPTEDLVARIYANAAFDIRFYSELPTPSPPHPSPHDPEVDLKLASIALSPVSGRESEFLLWFAKDLAEGLSSVDGFVRLRRFEFVQGVQRERNVVSLPDRPKYLVLAKGCQGRTEQRGGGMVWGEEGVGRGGRREGGRGALTWTLDFEHHRGRIQFNNNQ